MLIFDRVNCVTKEIANFFNLILRPATFFKLYNSDVQTVSQINAHGLLFPGLPNWSC